MLMPAGVLVVLILGSMAVDLSVVHLGEREVAGAAAGAANDAVTYGIDEAAVYGAGTYALDPGRVSEAVAISLAAQERSGTDLRLSGPPRLTDTDGDGFTDTVSITVRMEVDYVFAGALPRAPDGTTVEATATATARRD
jgi:hypothetical protein